MRADRILEASGIQGSKKDSGVEDPRVSSGIVLFFSRLVVVPSPDTQDGSLTDSNPFRSIAAGRNARGNGVSGTQRGRSVDETLICVLGLITLRSLPNGISRNA